MGRGDREKRGGGECSVNGGDGKDFCPNFLQPFLEKFDRRSCNDGSRELIPIYYNPQKRPTLSFGSGTYIGVPFNAASSVRVKKQVR